MWFSVFYFSAITEKNVPTFDGINVDFLLMHRSIVLVLKKIEEKWKFKNIVAPSFSACFSFFFSLENVTN